MTNQEVQQFFQAYCENMDKKAEMDEALLQTTTKQEWLAQMKARSVLQRELFLDNMAQLKRFLDWLAGHTLTEETAELLCEQVLAMYYADYDDDYVLLPVLDRLIPYYEERKDYNRLVHLYNCRFYEKIEGRYRYLDSEDPDEIVQDIERVFKLREHYGELEPKARQRIFTMYYNAIYIAWERHVISLDQAYAYLKQMLAFYQSPVVQALDGDDAVIAEKVNCARSEWLGNANDMDQCSKETRQDFYALTEEYRDLMQTQEAGEMLNYEVYIADVYCRMMRNELTPAEAMEAFYQNYLAYKEQLSKIDFTSQFLLVDEPKEITEALYFYLNAPIAMMVWIDKYKPDRALTRKYTTTFIQDIEAIWNVMYEHLPASFLDEELIQWCFHLMKHLDTPAEKLDMYERIYIKRHITTYIHSMMVARLAEQITAAVIDARPELFEGVFGYDAGEVVRHKEQMVTFACQGAKVHDIGKYAIASVIDTQTRNISDKEFQAIARHPQLGVKFLQDMDFLQEYRDIVLGHHRYFDGSRGYPETFDNTKSPIKPFIDIITICDCIDAATDVLGRNYVTAKSFAQILEELEAQKGTRYHPGVVAVIAEDAALQERLTRLVGEGRMELCYEVYEERMRELGIR